MPNAIFTFNSGRKQLLNHRHAELLQRLGKGSYITRDMADTPKVVKADVQPAFPGTDDPRTVEEVDAYIKAENAKIQQDKGDGLEELDADALRELAKERGVKVHARAGAEKLREALRSAA